MLSAAKYRPVVVGSRNQGPVFVLLLALLVTGITLISW